MRFAVTAIKTVLFTLVGKFEFTTQPTNHPPSAATGMLFFSENNVEIKVKRL